MTIESVAYPALAIGILIVIALLLRFGWRLIKIPLVLVGHILAHWLRYFILVGVIVLAYLLYLGYPFGMGGSDSHTAENPASSSATETGDGARRWVSNTADSLAQKWAEFQRRVTAPTTPGPGRDLRPQARAQSQTREQALAGLRARTGTSTTCPGTDRELILRASASPTPINQGRPCYVVSDVTGPTWYIRRINNVERRTQFGQSGGAGDDALLAESVQAVSGVVTIHYALLPQKPN